MKCNTVFAPVVTSSRGTYEQQHAGGTVPGASTDVWPKQCQLELMGF